ncbi:Dna2/Cas4 domain-containing protein [Candidatus Woesearchaeota archaeon]|nr:Dna2/Cas4 domain-containing protein [Candidatus Woesearchaeota archaeon]
MLSVSSLAEFLYCSRKLYLQEHHAERPPRAPGVLLRSERLRLIGKVDEVRKEGDAAIAVQKKTGRAPRQGVWPQHRVQMGAYLLLLEELHPGTEPEGVIRYARAERRVTLNPFLRYEVLETRDRALQVLQQRTLPPRIDDEKRCRACSLFSLCYDDNKMRELGYG